MRLLLLSASLVVVAAGPALAAPNAKLAEAKRLVDDLELEAAAKALDAAAAVAGNDRATMLDLYELQGVVHGTQGKTDKAREAFKALLVLDPEHKLSGNQPPRVRTPFYEAKDWAARNGPLALDADVQKTGAVVDAITLKVKGDGLRLAKAVAFHLDLSGKPRFETARLDASGKATVKVGAAGVKWWAELLGEKDAVLVHLGTAAAPRDEAPKVAVAPPVDPLKDVPPPPPPPPEVAQPAGGAWMRPTGIGLLAAGGVALGVGALMGLQANDAHNKVKNAARDANNNIIGITQREAAQLDAAERSNATVANVLFGTAAALAGTGLAFVILGGPSDDVTLTPSPGGVVVSGRF